MAPKTAQYRMADRLAKGKLAEILLAHKADGLNGEQASRQLYADYGIEATRQTIAVWTSLVEDDSQQASA